MKRLSKIDESTWGDMRKRAEGEQMRREDDVKYMDVEQFWLYLIKNYKEKVMALDKDHYRKEYDMDIVVDPSEDAVIFGSYVKDELVRIMVVLKTNEKNATVRKIIDTSPDNFRWIRIYSNKLELELNDGKVTNQTFVDLIEFFLNNQQVFESTWGDMRKRAEGNAIRREDDVNLMDMEGFIDYITAHYRFKQGRSYVTVNDMSIISIPMFSGVNVTYDDQANWVTASPSLANGLRQLFYKLQEEYIVTCKKEQKSKITFNMYIQIEPKKGEVTKQFYLDVLDFIIDNNPYDKDVIYIERI